MKITGTNSYIKVNIFDRIVKVNGERIVGGFIAYKTDIKNWEDSPNEKIEKEIKEAIIEEVESYTKNSHMIVTFE